ncbi:non-ribosomal peptide synthetase [Herbaspirillum camelliae]|uniref:non-ribosomal peptide synthetase n=1 Tax=Herbaspirillum camelliae TaxID=1892903 RepID=UPI000949F6BF|nr:non-ribosomal peptide synthetase [Herbaspirillum camelliae]
MHPQEQIHSDDVGFPLTAAQRSLLQQAAPALHLRLRLPAAIDAARLTTLLERLARRHQILRCQLRQVPGYRELRLVDGPPTIRLERIAHDDESAIAAWRAQAFGQAQTALWRAALLQNDASGQGRELWLACSPLVADYRSLVTLAGELMQPEHIVAEEVLQFGAFSDWLDDLVNGADNREAAAAGLAYWQAQAQPAGQAAPLPASRRNGLATAAPRIELFECALDAPLAQALPTQPAAAAERLHAVWLALLARLSSAFGEDGPRELASGWLHDCRADEHLQDMLEGAVGRFERVLPLRLRLEPQTGLRQWQAQLAQALQQHREQQEYLPEGAALPVLFGWRDEVAQPAGWATLELPGPPSGAELSLLALHRPEGWRLAWHFDTQHYGRQEIAVLAGQYRQLLARALAVPEQPLLALPLHGEALAAATLGQTESCLPTLTVAQMIAHRAAAQPQSPALAAGGAVLDYAGLEQRVERLAHALRSLGVAPGDIVALQLPRCAELVLALLATWRCGAAYLPLDTDSPVARRQQILQAGKVHLLVMEAGQSTEGLPADCMAVAWDELANSPVQVTSPLPGSRMDATAYVLFTSGSTGVPKGVLIGHAQLAAYVQGVTQALRLDACRHWALTGTVAADLGNTALFGALANGACLHVASSEDMRDAERFASFLRQHGIDALKIVPSHLDALLETPAPYLPATLVLGGEATAPALLARIRALAPQCRVFNHYGPTECTVGVLVHRAAAEADADADADVGASLPLTEALPHAYVRVLDAQLRPTPAGAIGQLWLGGAQLARGYLDAQQDSEAFIDDPWLPGRRLYRSGDLAVLLPQGGLRLAGRADHQVKVRGFRIEPGEIEAALRILPGVRQALVLAAPDGALAACLAADNGQALPAWRATLAEVLPAQMQPSRWLVLPELPRLGNGKVDRKALLEQLGRQDSGTPAVAAQAQGALATLLAQQMAQLLERPAIGANEDFFELGAHSLLVIKLIARIRQSLALEAAPALVFDHPNAIALAAALQAAAPDPDALERLAQARLESVAPAQADSMTALTA